ARNIVAVGARMQPEENFAVALPRSAHSIEPEKRASDLTRLFRAEREMVRQEWMAEMNRRALFKGLTLEESEAESAVVYDALVECLETGRYHSAQAYAQDMAERDVFRGIGAKQVIGRLLVLRDVCGWFLHTKYRRRPRERREALDLYERVINRILTIVVMAFLQEREKAVGQGREQLSALVEAGMILTAERSLLSVLQRIVEVACRLLKATYGALGVLDNQGRLEHFVTTGLDEGTRARIGSLPVGEGILGLLAREGKPLRIRDIAQDPRAHGFPPHHPAMHSFLGVPIISKGKLFGTLYLTEKHGAEEFSKEDEKLAVTLGAQAAVAIENASLYEQIQRSYEELKRSQRLLVRQEKLASLGRLAAGLAHELNNPLYSVAGFAEALQRRAAESQMGQASPEASDVQEYLGLIQEEVARAASIVRRLLDFARQREPAFSVVDIHSVVTKTVSFVQRQAHLANQRIIVEPFPEGSRVFADAQMLQQVFLNLLTNALDAIEEGGEIRITGQQSESEDTQGQKSLWVNVTVADTGIGIGPEDLSKVFDPFFTTKDVGKGTGLGLAICQSIVEQHRGSIEVKSEGRGKGAQVTISLPLSR
ncbi:MAG TPA: ATP-binding protein, partial [Spirochaetia bacterium]|nr:ATP-binding protein [Spirochaetia bacterium]